MIKALLRTCVFFSLTGSVCAGDFYSEYDAINSIWSGQTAYKRHFDDLQKIPGVSYVVENYESSHFLVSRKKLKASDSIFGKIPSFDLSRVDSYQLSTLSNKFVVLSGAGTGLFSVDNWKKFNFLQVLDVTKNWSPIIYSLPAYKDFSTVTLGVYDSSSNLNYLRVIPVRASIENVVEYEVVVYELTRGKVTPYKQDGRDVVFKVFKTESGWQVKSKNEAEYMIKNDKAERPYYMPVGL